MKKLLLLIALLAATACTSEDKRPHREFVTSCDLDSNRLLYIYYFGEDKKQSETKSWPTRSAAMSAARKDGCSLRDEASRYITACCE